MIKALSNLGLAMRAGKLVTGDEAVLKAVRSAEAKLVILAADASDNTQKKFRDKCGTYDIPLVITMDRETLGASIGKESRVVLAVTEQGFADMIARRLEEHAGGGFIDQTRQ